MVSRIVTEETKKQYPDCDNKFKYLAKGRCLMFYNINDGRYTTIRMLHSMKEIEPLIAKGNRFDGVEAIW